MAEGPRATVRLMASRLYDTPSAGRSGEELAQATGLSVRDISRAVDWLEFHGYAHVDRALGGSPSVHLFVAVAPTSNSACHPRETREDARARARETVQGALEGQTTSQFPFRWCGMKPTVSGISQLDAPPRPHNVRTEALNA
jgi:hypothetical protein